MSIFYNVQNKSPMHCGSVPFLQHLNRLQKKLEGEDQICEIEQKYQKPLHLLDFNDDVAVMKERKTGFGTVADPPFSFPRLLLVFIFAIEKLPEVSVPYKQTTVNFYKNHKETQLYTSQTTWSYLSVRNSVIMSCLIDQCLKTNWDFLRRRGI